MTGNGKMPRRDGTTFTAALVYMRAGADSSYQHMAIAIFGHENPTSYEINCAIERVLNQGVRAGELAWVERDD